MHKGGRDELQKQMVICLQIFTYNFLCFFRVLDEFKT